MTHAHTPRSLSATTVIAAVLALGTTPALAQTAAPDATASPPAEAAPPSAASLAPPPPSGADTTPAPTPQVSSTPVVQAIPPGHEPPQATTDDTPAAAPAQPAPAPVARHHIHTGTAMPIPRAIPSAQPAIPPSPLLADQGVTPPPQPASVAQPPRPAHLPDAAWAVALAAAVGATLAGSALIIGRRRREDEDTFEAPTYAPTPDPTAEIANTTSPLTAPVLTPRHAAYPDGPIPAGAAREALLERMVAADPDAENPFTSHKARLHRARLILAGREQALKDKATEPFDWRSYRPSRDLAETDESVIVRDPAHA